MNLPAPTYGEYWPNAGDLWDEMERTRKSAAEAAAEKIKKYKDTYLAIEKVTGVPWWWIGISHFREEEKDVGIFKCYLGNGQSLNKKTTLKPYNRGPFYGDDAFIRGAIDALEVDSVNKVKDWTLEKALYFWEKFNGFAYWMYHNRMPSPYVWASTNIQMRGKYLENKNGSWFDPHEMDTQLGAAAILKSLMEIDDTIKPIRETPKLGVTPIPTKEIIMPPINVPVTTQSAGFTLDLNKIESALETIQRLVPGAATFIPQVKMLIPALAGLHLVIDFAQELENSPKDFRSIGLIATKNIRLLCDQIDAALAPTA